VLQIRDLGGCNFIRVANIIISTILNVKTYLGHIVTASVQIRSRFLQTKKFSTML